MLEDIVEMIMSVRVSLILSQTLIGIIKFVISFTYDKIVWRKNMTSGEFGKVKNVIL